MARKVVLVQCRLVESYTPLKVSRLLVISVGENLVDLFVLEGMELDIDQASDILNFGWRKSKWSQLAVRPTLTLVAGVVKDKRRHGVGRILARAEER